MGRYTGPKGRVNRRLGAMVYESNGAIKHSNAETIHLVCTRVATSQPTSVWA